MSSTKKPAPQHAAQVGAVEHFIVSGLAPSLAAIFTNPFDTAKVRLQLQGENLASLKRAGQVSEAAVKQVKIYNNSWDCMVKTWRFEGLSGLQRGLTPALLRESTKNVFRLGLFDPILSLIHDRQTYPAVPIWKRFAAGALSGAVGALSCNPFELVKTRLQSQANVKIIVGYQHSYTGVMDALRKIVKEDGYSGLYRGSTLGVMRSIVASGVNLTCYSSFKDYCLGVGIADSAMVDISAGMISGVATVLAANPIDVVRTRYYNQPYKNGVGVLYANGIDAFGKIIKYEGWKGLYKGVVTHWLRLGPHFTLTFLLSLSFLVHHHKLGTQ